jgi:hypothetical protein
MGDVTLNMRAGPVAIAVVVVFLSGGGIFSGLVWAAAKGAFGKLGEARVSWLLEHSMNPKDVEHVRELALRRQSEEERWGEHRRQLEKMKQESLSRVPTFTIPPPIRKPVLIPQGMCVLDGDNFKCNAAAACGYYADDGKDDGWGRTKDDKGQEIDWQPFSPK